MTTGSGNPAPDSPEHILRNEHLEIGLNLALGRIMRLSSPGGPNLLWTDPLATRSKPDSEWQNHGGEKAWLWPQDSWPEHFGLAWPPPFEQPACLLLKQPALLVWAQAMRFLNGSEARIIRRFKLDETSPSLRVSTTLETDDPASRAIFRPWSVLQLPRPELIRIHAAGPGRHRASPKAGHLFGAAHGWTLDPHTRSSGKWFFDAHRLEAKGAYGTLRMELSRSESLAPSTLPAETAQVYLQGEDDVAARHLPPYVELEFVAPLPGLDLDLRLSLGS